MSRASTSVSHLQFAGDLFIFGKEGLKETRKIEKCLQKYEQLSGQSINMNKSFVISSRYVNQRSMCEITHKLKLKRAKPNEVYLWISVNHMSKCKILKVVVERVKGRTHQRWKFKVMS